MRKRSKLIVIFSAIIIVLGVGVTLYKSNSFYKFSNDYLASKEETESSFYSKKNEISTTDSESFDFGKFTGKWSLMEFTSDKGNKITISDNTKIDKGKFYSVVLDKNYNIMAKKDRLNDKGNITFTTPNSGKYIIRIVGQNAGGSFNLKISAGNNIDVSHKDFFE